MHNLFLKDNDVAGYFFLLIPYNGMHNIVFYMISCIIQSYVFLLVHVLTHDLSEDSYHLQHFVFLSHKTNTFHVAVGLFGDRSQKMSKCEEKISDTHGCPSCVTFLF